MAKKDALATILSATDNTHLAVSKRPTGAPTDVPTVEQPKTYVCIRRCEWGPTVQQRRIYKVGEVVKAAAMPNKHFAEFTCDEDNILCILRKKLDKAHAMYGSHWDLEELTRAVTSAEKRQKDKAAAEAARKAA